MFGLGLLNHAIQTMNLDHISFGPFGLIWTMLHVAAVTSSKDSLVLRFGCVHVTW